jgi:hypothetical protein
MTGWLIILFTLIMAFLEKPHLFKKPISTAKIIMSAALIITAGFSIFKDINEKQEQEANSLILQRSGTTIDSLNINSSFQNGLILRQNALIDSLRGESKTAALEYQDSLKNYHYNTVTLLAKYGLKVDTLRGEVSKIGTHQQAHLALLPQTNSGFKASRNLDTFSLNGWIVNDGTGQAFGIHIETQLFFLMNDIAYRDMKSPYVNLKNLDIVPNIQVAIEHEFLLSNTFYEKITEFVLTISGTYYTDYERKNKRAINTTIIYDPGKNTIRNVEGSLWQLFKSAKFADFLHK